MIFFALSFGLGGGVFAVSLLGGRSLHLANGMLHAGVDLKIVLLAAAGCYAISSVLLRGVGRRNAMTGEVIPVEINMHEKQKCFTVLHDTGNTLCDPVTGRGVLVVDWDVVLPLVADLQKSEVTNPTRALTGLNTGKWKGRWGLIPYRAVGVECGMLLTLRPDRVIIGGRDCGRMCLALSPSPVSPGGGWRGLVGDEI